MLYNRKNWQTIRAYFLPYPKFVLFCLVGLFRNLIVLGVTHTLWVSLHFSACLLSTVPVHQRIKKYSVSAYVLSVFFLRKPKETFPFILWPQSGLYSLLNHSMHVYFIIGHSSCLDEECPAQTYLSEYVVARLQLVALFWEGVEPFRHEAWTGGHGAIEVTFESHRQAPLLLHGLPRWNKPYH